MPGSILRLENVAILRISKEARGEPDAHFLSVSRAILAGGPTKRVDRFDVEVDKDSGRIRRIIGAGFITRDEGCDDGAEVERVDCDGLAVMPGMIDSHVHVTASSANLRMPASMPPSLVYCRAVPILGGMLSRGFTTVRDCGGADHGLAAAIAEGTIVGPRVVFCGKALSQTGGHGDFRTAGENALPFGPCKCCNYTIGRVCDGVTACREAVRDEARKGAGHIKIMASGGVSSPTDRLEQLQFSEEELRAIVSEANNAKIYCAAHAYTDEAVARAVRCGVKSIEHGNYASEATLEKLASAGGFLVPTLITYDRLRKDGVQDGMAPELVAKVGDLVEAGQRCLAAAKKQNVDVCYGSDLLGAMHGYQALGINLHLAAPASVGAADVLASLTVTPARMMRMEKDIGSVEVGFLADLIVVEPEVLLRPGEVLTNEERIRVIVKNGRVFKNTLGVKTHGVKRESEPSGAPAFEREAGRAEVRRVVKREAEESQMSTASGRMKRERQ